VNKQFEFWCHYCQGWVPDTVHRPNHHNDVDKVDAHWVDRWRSSVDGGQTWVEHEEEPDDLPPLWGI
jgi:hypothetical protein